MPDTTNDKGNLGPETLDKRGVFGVLGLQHLDGDGAPERLVLGAPHLTHAADGDAGVGGMPAEGDTGEHVTGAVAGLRGETDGVA